MITFLAKLSKKERIGLFFAMGFILLSLIDGLIVRPIRVKIQQISREIELSEKQLGRDLRNLSQKDVITKEYKKYKKYVIKVGSDEEETAKILGEIEGLARKSSIYLVDIKPQTPRNVDFYEEYAVEIEAEGETGDIVNFLHQLNTSPLLLRAKKIRLNLKRKDSVVISAAILVTKVLIP